MSQLSSSPSASASPSQSEPPSNSSPINFSFQSTNPYTSSTRNTHSSPHHSSPSRFSGGYGPESADQFNQFFSEFKRTLWPEESRSPQMLSPLRSPQPENMLGQSQTRSPGILVPRTIPSDSRNWRFMGLLPKPGELPAPMRPEEQKEDMENLGMNVAALEKQRQKLREWFSKQLLKPLVNKIDTSHQEVMASAAQVGFQVSLQCLESPGNLDPEDPAGIFEIAADKAVATTLNGIPMDEDALLIQLKSSVQHALANLPTTAPTTGFGFNQSQQYQIQQQSQQNQLDFQKNACEQCIECIVSHQRLRAILKGERGNGVLPFPKLTPAYAIQRIKELAKGYAVESYSWDKGGSYIPSSAKGQPIPSSPLSNLPSPVKPWSDKLPSDTHFLLYLFLSFLLHPKWQLHREMPIYPQTKWTRTPVYMGDVPPVHVCPCKCFVAVSGTSQCTVSNLPVGAFVLATGTDVPAVLVLYWNQKPQFSIMGLNALWDTILIILHHLKMEFDGIIQDVALDSPSLDLIKIIT